MNGQTPERSEPPARVRVVGHLISRVVARAPFVWPLLKGTVRRFFDDRAHDWDIRADRNDPQKLASMSAACLEIKERPERILDIGTGTGVGALMLAREWPSARIRGVDLSEEMVRKAQAKVGLDPEARVAFKVADASALPYEDDSFDLVTQLNVPPFFAEIARVLRPGGSIIVASTNGPRTPLFTPHTVLERQFARHGVSAVSSGAVGTGTWWLGTADPD